MVVRATQHNMFAVSVRYEEFKIIFDLVISAFLPIYRIQVSMSVAKNIMQLYAIDAPVGSHENNKMTVSHRD